MRISARFLLLLAAIPATGCLGPRASHLPAGDAAYAVIPAADVQAAPVAYTIRPSDVLRIMVFQEPELGAEKIAVDDAGTIQMPLIGEVQAAGTTAADLGRTIAGRLGSRYVRNPRVTVEIVERVAQTFAIEGHVNEPGVYLAAKGDTLLSALARAKSPSRVAKLDEVVVFRHVNGQRMAARFDVNAIRTGRAADPQILGGDTVVVGFSAMKGAFRDALQVAPLFNLFTTF